MYHLTCPECKNDVDLSQHQELKNEQIIECNHCGITLQISNIKQDRPICEVETEIIEEGK